MRKRTIFSLMAIMLIAVTVGPVFAGGQKAITGEAKQRTFAIVYPLIHPVFDTCTKSAQEEAAKQGGKTNNRWPYCCRREHADSDYGKSDCPKSRWYRHRRP